MNSNEENFVAMLDSSTRLMLYECAPYRTPSYVLYSALVSFFIPFFVTVALYVRIGVEIHRRHASRRIKRRMMAGGNRGTSTVAMMCRVGHDLCTAATAAVVIDRLELDEEDTGQSATPSGRRAG